MTNFLKKIQIELNAYGWDWRKFSFTVVFPLLFLHAICLIYIIRNFEQIIKNPIYSTAITWYNEHIVLFSTCSLIILAIMFERINSYIVNNFDSTKENKALIYLQSAVIIGFVFHFVLLSINVEIAYNLWHHNDTLYRSKVWFLSDITRAMTEDEARIQLKNASLAFGEFFVKPEKLPLYYEIVGKEIIKESIFESCYSQVQDRETFAKAAFAHLHAIWSLVDQDIRPLTDAFKIEDISVTQTK